MSSEIEKELQGASKIKPKPKEDEQTYFKRLIDAVQELPDEKWEKLSTDAQNWVNTGATAVNKDKDVQSFPDDEPPAEEEGAEEEAAEEEAPPARRSSRRSAAAEEEEEAPKAGRSSRRARGDEPAEDEEPPRRKRRAAAEEEEEPPRRTRRVAAEEEPEAEAEPETETEEESVASKRKGGKGAIAKKQAAKSKPQGDKKPGAQLTIKKLVIGNPKLTSEQIVEKLKAKDLKASASAVSTIRSGTLQTMRLIKEIGMPKGDF